mgnify:CR=1 FL=1
MAISDVIKERILNDNGTYLANDNISKYIEEGELDLLQKEVEEKLKGVLSSLIIDTQNDHNTIDTPKRIAKMWIKEVFKGSNYNKMFLYSSSFKASIKDFLNRIKFNSFCFFASKLSCN